jgi:hypothetical protein
MQEQQAGNREKPASDPLRSVVELVGLVSLLAAVLGVAGAYLGWHVSRAYFGSLSINPGWLAADMPSMILIGYVEIVLLILLFVAFILSRIALLRLAERLRPSSSRRLLVVLLGVAVVLTATSLLRFFTMLGSAGYVEWGVLYGMVPLTWWMCAVLGDYLYGGVSRAASKPRGKLNASLSLVFSSRPVWWLLTVALTVFYLTQFSMYHGMYIGARDKSEATHLPFISILSDMPLEITGGQRLAGASPACDLYLYSDLRLIDPGGEYVFVLRTAETDPVTGSARVYVVPLKYVVSLEIGQRFLASPTPVPISTTVVSLTPSTTGVP